MNFSIINRFLRFFEERFRWVLVLGIVLTASSASAQQVVQGKVTASDDGSGLPGVTIQVKGTQSGAISDVDGNYTVSVTSQDVLVFSYVGYLTQEIAVGTRSTIDVSLEVDAIMMDEVVVVGYGVQRERDLTSAITTVTAEEIAKTPTGQAMQALQGRVPGVQIVSNGAPGASPTVRVRGIGSFPVSDDSQPLYVVDGMFFDDIDFLNTSDIATISVLKDASAASIYGVRSANGVVLIETKSGSYNQEAQITYDGYYGVQVPQNVLRMSNAEQFTNYINDYTAQSGDMADATFIENAFQRYGRSRINPNIPAVNTDWYDEVMRSAAPIQNHSIGISGGTGEARYSVGASYFEQEGLLEQTRNSYERVNFRTKVDFDANEWLTIGGNVNLSNATQYNADAGTWFRTYFAVPILPVYDELNVDAAPFPVANAQELGYRGTQNPYFNLLYNDNRSNIGKILGNFYADMQLIPNKLSFRTAYNYNFQSIVARNVDKEFNTGQVQNLNSVFRRSTTVFNKIWDNVLTYQTNFDRHSFTVLAGYSYRSEITEGSFAQGVDIDTFDPDNEATWFIPSGPLVNGDNSGDFGTRLFGSSYFGRIAYNYDDRYLLYGTFRRDGTNKYQEKWGNFTTIGAGWVASEESFFNVDAIDFLKVRGSWGQLGNDGVGASVGQVTVNSTSTAIDDQLVAGLVVDPDFDFVNKWESTEETNIGLTARMLNNRLSIEADYYVRDTKDAVTQLLLPSNRNVVRRNIAEIRNSGLEMALNWTGEISNNFTYSIGGNFATLNNEVLGLGGQTFLDAGSAEFRQRSAPGASINEFFGYEVAGVFQSVEQITASGYNADFVADNGIEPGDFMYTDQNKDGVIDADDRVFLGSFLPSLTYGFDFGINYKSLTLTANFQGQSGHSILNRKRGEVIFTTDTNIDAELADNLWNGEGSGNRYPSAAGLRKPYNQAMSDYFVEDGSYFRIQNVRVAYQLVGKEVLGIEVPNSTVTFTAERPLTIFDYNGFNPEVANGIDRQTFPIPAVYTLGLNVKL